MKEPKVPMNERLMAWLLDLKVIVAFVMGWEQEGQVVNMWAWHIITRAVQFAIYAAVLSVLGVAFWGLPFSVVAIAVMGILWLLQIGYLVLRVVISVRKKTRK